MEMNIDTGSLVHGQEMGEGFYFDNNLSTIDHASRHQVCREDV